MFGYIKLDGYAPVQYRDYFKRNYCFLCRALDKHYGLFARLFVSYDVTFFNVLFSPENYLSKIKKISCYSSTKQLKEKLLDEYSKKVAALNLALAAGELKDNIDDKDISSVRMKDANGFYLDVARVESLPRDMTTMRMNADDFDEAYELLKAHGFKNARGEDQTIDSKSARSCLMISPSGFSIQLTQHIKK